MLYFLGKWICYLSGQFKYKVIAYGKDNVPKKGGFILACNHIAWTDPIVLGIHCRRMLHFMAKQELFENKFFGFILRNLGVFSVSRGTGDQNSLHTAVDIINDGHVMAIFPEGTRSKTGSLLRPKSGVILVAGQTKADILPAAVKIVRRKGRRDLYYVMFGEMIKNQEINVTDTHSLVQIKAAGKLLMGRIQKLLDATEKGIIDG